MPNIKGFQPVSLIDYPGKISAVIFLGRCNFRCGFCHNPLLVKNEGKNLLTSLRSVRSLLASLEDYDEKELLGFLKNRKKFIEGVCITGGEPCLDKDLQNFILKIKKMGYPIKLDTNGSFPKVLKNLIGIVDYIAMDIKVPLDKYKEVTGFSEIEKLKESIDIVKKAKDYEFRTTVVPSLLDEKDILKICNLLKGSKRYILQQFRNNFELLDESFRKVEPYSKKELEELAVLAGPFFEEVFVRA